MSAILDFLGRTILSEQLVYFVLFVPGLWMVLEVGHKKPGWQRRSMFAYVAIMVPLLPMLALGVTGKASVLQMTSALAGGVFGPMLGSALVPGRRGLLFANKEPQAQSDQD